MNWSTEDNDLTNTWQWIIDKWGRLGISNWWREIWHDISTSSSTQPMDAQYWLSNGQTNRCVHVHNIDTTSTADTIAHLPYVSNYGWMRHTALSNNSANKWWNDKMWHSLWMLLCYILQAVITVLVAETCWCCQQCLGMSDSGPTAVPDVTKSEFLFVWCLLFKLDSLKNYWLVNEMSVNLLYRK
jgi:hypothetical protein